MGGSGNLDTPFVQSPSTTLCSLQGGHRGGSLNTLSAWNKALFAKAVVLSSLLQNSKKSTGLKLSNTQYHLHDKEELATAGLSKTSHLWLFLLPAAVKVDCYIGVARL